MSRWAGPLLVGREAEYSQVSGIVEEAVAGHGAIVLVVGEPGIGKTALLTSAHALAHERGMWVLRGSAIELEHTIPFATIASCLLDAPPAMEPMLEQSRSLLRAETAIDQAEARREYAVVESLLTLVDNACTKSPVAVMVDDIQWADRSSLLVLERLSALIEQLPLLLVLTTRPVPQDRALTGLLRRIQDRAGAWVRLGPLPHKAVTTLAEQVIGTRIGPKLAADLASAAGNPLYLTELATGLIQAGLVTVTDGVAERVPSRGGLPASLTDAIMQRLDFLPASAQHTLTMAASLGPEVEPSELSAALELPFMQIWQAVQAAAQAGLLVRSEGFLTFRHELIRRILAEQVPAATRRHLQTRTAKALITSGARPERIAGYLAAGDTLDVDAVHWLVDSGDRLIVQAPQLAVELLERALAIISLTAETREVLQLRRVRALLWSARTAEAETAARSALAAVGSETDSPIVRALRWLLTQACHRQGHFGRAVAEAKIALDQPGLSEQEQAEYHGFISLTLALMADFRAAEQTAHTAIALGDTLNNPAALGFGHMALGVTTFASGDLPQAMEHADRVIDAYHRGIVADRSDLFDPHVGRVHCLIELGQLNEADEQAKTAIKFCQENNGIYLGPNMYCRARTLALSGQWDDALAEIDGLTEIPDSLGYAPAGGYLADLIAIRRNTYTGDPRTSPSPASNLGGQIFAYYLRAWLTALYQEKNNRPAEAASMLAAACAHARGKMASHWVHEMWPDLARIAAAAGDSDVLDTVVGWAERFAAEHDIAHRHGTALLCRGIAEHRPDLLTQSATAYQRAGRPHYQAQAHENLAVVLAETNRTAEARTALDTALDLYNDLDADADIARTKARLRRRGIRRGNRNPLRRPKKGWDALTPTEHKVATLVAKGMSNTEIAAYMYLSRRTVQSHVSSILTKLDLHSRVHIAITLTNQT